MPQKSELLTALAAKYVWWSSPAEAMVRPMRLAAHIMNMGDYEDVQRLVAALGEDYLRDVLKHAEIGQFNARSWAYWHYRLGVAKPGQVPPLPTRMVG